MKYLMLDTNIYIDMIVSREQSHKPETYNQLIKLLDFGEIKLIVPNIVITELYRHIDDTINKIGIDIDKIKKMSSELNWFNNVEALKQFRDNIKITMKGIDNLKSDFSTHKNTYKGASKELFKKMFSHENCIQICENEDIILKAMKRQIHQLRPFHYGNKKDSLADSIIIETLININKLIEFNKDEDSIFFISRNTSDFGKDKDSDEFHNDIKNSIEKTDMLNCLFYRIHFTKTLVNDFKNEIEAVKLTEDLVRELEEEQRELAEMYNEEYIDYEREMCGLSCLQSEDYYEEIINQKIEIENLIQDISELKMNLYEKEQEFYDNYYNLDEVIKEKTIDELKSTLKNNPLFNVLIDYDDEEDIVYGIIDCFQEKIGDEDYAQFSNEFYCKEIFSLNETLLSFFDNKDNKYELRTEGTLMPRNNDSDDIYIELIKNSKIISKARINVDYGYGELNDNGNIGDGREESIDIFDIDKLSENLISKIQNIIDDIDGKIKKIKQIIIILEN